MNLLELYNNGTLDINACLQETDTGYRKLDPGSYLYDMVLEYKYDRGPWGSYRKIPWLRDIPSQRPPRRQ